MRLAKELITRRYPSKFINPNGSFAMFYSGGWSGPTPLPPELHKTPTLIDYPSAQYTLCVAEFQLDMKKGSYA